MVDYTNLNEAEFGLVEVGYRNRSPLMVDPGDVSTLVDVLERARPSYILIVDGDGININVYDGSRTWAASRVSVIADIVDKWHGMGMFDDNSASSTQIERL